MVQPLNQFNDERGWLSELWRLDEADVPSVMCYASMTHAGMARGPHEHVHQTDVFIFLTGRWRVRLWDNRVGSTTHLAVMDVEIGDYRLNPPVRIVVPPGVVHAYAKSGHQDGLVLNFPDKLYRGAGKQEPPDEIRHEGNKTYSMEGMP